MGAELQSARPRRISLIVDALLWILAVTGGILVLVSFTLDFQIVLQEMQPPPFRWGLFAAGLTLSVVAVAFGVSRLAFPLNRLGEGGMGQV